jgi:nucleotidyltransferase substrate binding protein (TIGR01987 family)
MAQGNKDIRWKQRFSNYKKALTQLAEFINKNELTKLEEIGMIKAFEFTFELAWNVIKDYFQYQGITGIQGSRDAFRTAFKQGLIEDGETWMSMIESRIQTTHTYNESVASDIAKDIINSYYDRFKKLESKLENLAQDND